jgi:rRNA maturation protein Nop10
MLGLCCISKKQTKHKEWVVPPPLAVGGVLDKYSKYRKKVKESLILENYLRLWRE